jgi:hypothetical protein
MGQKDNLPQTDICKNFNEMAAIIENDSTKVSCITDLKGAAVSVNHRLLDGAVQGSRKTSNILASTTTANSRVVFYRALEILKDSVCYMDTGLFT